MLASANQRINTLDQLSVNNLSSKHMDYNQMMLALGKGRKIDFQLKMLEPMERG